MSFLYHSMLHTFNVATLTALNEAGEGRARQVWAIDVGIRHGVSSRNMAQAVTSNRLATATIAILLRFRLPPLTRSYTRRSQGL